MLKQGRMVKIPRDAKFEAAARVFREAVDAADELRRVESLPRSLRSWEGYVRRRSAAEIKIEKARGPLEEIKKVAASKSVWARGQRAWMVME